MDLERQFAEALFPVQRFTLCVGLRPLTLGHVFLLHRARSPFVAGGAASRGDLLLALFICSRPWRKASRQIGGLWFRAWCCLVPSWGMAWQHGLEQFGDYLRRSITHPKIVVRKKPNAGENHQESALSAFQLLFANQTYHWRRPKADALDTTVEEAGWDWAYWLELSTSGGAGFETDLEQAVRTECEKTEREMSA